MNMAVVDTDVVSFLFKGHTSASWYRAKILGFGLAVSFMTIAELNRWIIKARWGERRQELLQQFLHPFAIIPSSNELCKKWAEVTAGAEARGRRIECADAWNAAAALVNGVPLVTHNRDDYRGVPGLQVISHGS